PIPGIELLRAGASAVVLAEKDGRNPRYTGVEDAIAEPGTDIRIFGKPSTRPYRRMAVTLASGSIDSDVDALKLKSIANARKVKVESEEDELR
ncbi:MAG: phosphoribosylglycinamide formyltransferase 2, partial [Chlorobiaceae bacterium]|nr:phosphoribosylglycinamide formyltransferase 2 [Chlorobiaceae bacterium]